MLNFIKTKISKTPEVFITVFSILAVAQINYAIVHSSFVYLAILVMLAHELGHYYFAKLHKGNPKLPIFIPIPFFAIGLTKVAKLGPHATKKVALAGPFFGFTAAALLILFNSIFNFTAMTPLFVLAFSELVFNYIGSDGSRYRKAKRDIKICIS